MTQTVPLAAQLGAAYSGDTIHYRILNGDGTEYATWTSSGVTEIGTTGTYFVAGLVNAPDEGAFVQWSNDAGSTTLAAVATIEAAAPTTAALVAALMAEVVEGSKSYKEAFLDLWAVIVGDSAADDGDEPTSITYDSPDGSVQRTHAITETTRTVS